MSTFFSQFNEFLTPATIKYGVAGSTTKGEFSSGTPVSAQINIIIPQPLSGEDLKMLEDGERASDFLKTWVASDYDPKTTSGGIVADIINYGGVDYKIHNVGVWDTLGRYRKIILRDLGGV